jgi:hypothetical protein
LIYKSELVDVLGAAEILAHYKNLWVGIAQPLRPIAKVFIPPVNLLCEPLYIRSGVLRVQMSEAFLLAINSSIVIGKRVSSDVQDNDHTLPPRFPNAQFSEAFMRVSGMHQSLQ